MAKRIDVFISSTSRDLEAYRAAVTQVVISLGMYPIGMEGFTPTGDNALQLCYDKVQEAEVFIGIYAHRYGYAPGAEVSYQTTAGEVQTGNGETGITHFEYQWALERKLPMFLFVIKNDAPWNPEFIEDEPGKSRLKAFKEMILGKHVVGFFSSPDELATQVATALASIKPTFQPRRDFYQHIPMPPNFVPREALLAEIRALVLGESTEVGLTSGVTHGDKGAYALQGMGGIGKSVMARALCEDEQIKAAFPDGILWTTLGQEADLKVKLREWIQALGGTLQEKVPTIDALTAQLGQLLENRTCLLIVDDAWQREQIDPFRVGGVNCRLLITTRNANIVEAVGATVKPVPIMAQAEAIQLLDEWTGGRDIPDELKITIVERVGRLPLAIKLAGGQIKRRDAQDWLDKFDNPGKLKIRKPKDIHDSLELTFKLSLDALDEEDRRLYAALGIFKEDEPILEHAIEKLWTALDDVDPDDIPEIIDELGGQALLQVVQDTYPRAVILHDLLRDFVIDDLGDEQQNTHQALLDAYAQTQTDGGWHTAPDDGYLYDHLTYHLKAAGQLDDLKSLFVNQDWLYARVPSDGYSYAGYRADIDEAWAVAESAAYAHIENGEFPESLVDCLRYALIYTSINSLSGNYVPAIVAQALKTAHPNWSVERALNIAEQIPDAEQKIEMYVAILETGQVPKHQLATIQREVLNAALNIESEYRRVEALIALAPKLSGEQQIIARQGALQVALNLSEESARAEALIALAPQLERDAQRTARQEALTAALNIPYEHSRARALTALAPYLDGDLLQQALTAALNIQRESARASALTALAPQLQGDQQRNTHQEALTSTLSIHREDDLAEALSTLAPQLDGDLLQQALNGALKLQTFFLELCRARALTALAPHLQGGSQHTAQQAALHAALNISIEVHRVSALTALAPQLHGDSQHTALQQALTAALNIQRESDRASALTALAPHLSDDLLHEALNAALNLYEEDDRIEALITLAPHLHGEQQRTARQQALTAAINLSDEYRRARALTDLAPHLHGEQQRTARQQALTAALNIRKESARARALTALAPQLQGDAQRTALQGALTIALNISDDHAVDRALINLTPQFTDDWLQKAYNIALNLSTASARAEALTALASQLEGNLLHQAFNTALNMQWNSARARALTALAPHLHGDAQRHALQQAHHAALNISDESDRANVLTALIPALVGKQQRTACQEALNTALNIQREYDRARALTALIPHLDGDLLHQTLTAALNISDEYNRANVLTALIPQLEGDQKHTVRQQALNTTLSITDEDFRASTLTALIPHLEVDQQPAIRQEAYTAALNISSEITRASVLTALIPQLEGDQKHTVRQQALNTALSITDESFLTMNIVIKRKLARGEYFRSYALTALTPHLEEDLLLQVLAAGLNIAHEIDRARVMANLLPLIPEQQAIILQSIYQAVVGYLQTSKTEQRSEILEIIAKEKLFAPPIFSKEALGEIAETIIEICNEWEWL